MTVKEKIARFLGFSDPTVDTETGLPEAETASVTGAESAAPETDAGSEAAVGPDAGGATGD